LPYYAAVSQGAGLVRLSGLDAAGPPPRRPHKAAAVERMRQLYETTRLPVRAIAAQTGASAATVSRRARRHGWLRPGTGVAEEHYTAAGRRKLRRGAIAEALLARAERLAFQRETDPGASSRQLTLALRLVRAAQRLDEAEQPKRGRKRRRRLSAAEKGVLRHPDL
jgi:hypothetical protein